MKSEKVSAKELLNFFNSKMQIFIIQAELAKNPLLGDLLALKLEFNRLFHRLGEARIGD